MTTEGERVNERADEKEIDLLWVFKMLCINFDRDLQQREGFHCLWLTFHDVMLFAFACGLALIEISAKSSFPSLINIIVIECATLKVH
jgi:hypothetical protein